MFVLLYSNDYNNTKRYNTKMYYLPKDFVKKCNIVISGKNVYDESNDLI